MLVDMLEDSQVKKCQSIQVKENCERVVKDDFKQNLMKMIKDCNKW